MSGIVTEKLSLMLIIQMTGEHRKTTSELGNQILTFFSLSEHIFKTF